MYGVRACLCKQAERVMIAESIHKTIGFRRLDELVAAKLRDWLLHQTATLTERLEHTIPTDDSVDQQAQQAAAVEEGTSCTTSHSAKAALQVSLGNFYGSMGHFEQARTLLEQAYAWRVVHLGAADESTLEAMGNLSICLRQV